MPIRTPDWVKDAVFYQVFPDRFARGGNAPPPPGLQLMPWGSPPAEQGFQGGDLDGIRERLDYLQDLGITALYLNPIFTSASNHRYHTFDYENVDPLLGGNAALRRLVDAMHERGMRIVLDGVFNHASRGFWAFHHILENRERSPYLDWFLVKGWPLRPYGSDAHHPPNYECWWDLPALPKFNTRNPGVREYLLHVARRWIDFGIDGWRLDVPEEIDDPEFWRAFRATVKEGNPDAWLCGEIWGEAPEWLAGDRFDAVMNYPLARAGYGFFAAETLPGGYEPGGYPLEPLDAGELADRVDRLMSVYEWEVVLAQLNLVGSHDTARSLWMVGEDETAIRLLALFQMTLPGAPCVYYGDEIGMTGGHDPDCRAAFPWGRREEWNREILSVYLDAIAMRHRNPVLRTGTLRRVLARDGLYVFARELDDRTAVVALNARRQPASVPAADLGLDVADHAWRVAWGRPESVSRSGIEVPARDGIVLVGAEG